MQLTPLKGPVGGLYDLPVSASRYGLPDRYQDAQALFASASADYAAGKAAGAAKKFLEVAQLLKAPTEPTTYSDQFAAMREAVYRDVALAFEAAEDPDGARTALTRAQKTDPENAAVLTELLKQL